MRRRHARFLLVTNQQDHYWPITLRTLWSRKKWGLVLIRFDAGRKQPCEHGRLTHTVACLGCLFPEQASPTTPTKEGDRD